MRRVHAMDTPEWDPVDVIAGRRPTTEADAGPMGATLEIELRQLCQEARDDLAYHPSLTRREARSRIAVLIEELGMRLLPPHTD